MYVQSSDYFNGKKHDNKFNLNNCSWWNVADIPGIQILHVDIMNAQEPIKYALK